LAISGEKQWDCQHFLLNQENADGSLQEISLFTVAMHLNSAKTNHRASKVFDFLLLLSKAG